MSQGLFVPLSKRRRMRSNNGKGLRDMERIGRRCCEVVGCGCKAVAIVKSKYVCEDHGSYNNGLHHFWNGGKCERVKYR